MPDAETVSPSHLAAAAMMRISSLVNTIDRIANAVETMSRAIGESEDTELAVVLLTENMKAIFGDAQELADTCSTIHGALSDTDEVLLPPQLASQGLEEVLAEERANVAARTIRLLQAGGIEIPNARAAAVAASVATGRALEGAADEAAERGIIDMTAAVSAYVAGDIKLIISQPYEAEEKLKLITDYAEAPERLSAAIGLAVREASEQQ